MLKVAGRFADEASPHTKVPCMTLPANLPATFANFSICSRIHFAYTPINNDEMMAKVRTYRGAVEGSCSFRFLCPGRLEMTLDIMSSLYPDEMDCSLYP